MEHICGTFEVEENEFPWLGSLVAAKVKKVDNNGYRLTRLYGEGGALD